VPEKPLIIGSVAFPIAAINSGAIVIERLGVSHGVCASDLEMFLPVMATELGCYNDL
jgi:hypothetical protein